MARVPTIKPTGNQITTQPAARTVDVGAASTAGTMLFKLGAGLEDIAGQLAKAQDHAERTKASNDFETKALEIKSRAQNDQDTSAARFKHYEDELSKAAENSSSGISTPGSRGLFLSDTKPNTFKMGLEIAEVFRNRQKEERAVEVVRKRDLMGHFYSNTRSSKERNFILSKYDRFLTESASLGLVDASKAEEEKISVRNKFGRSFMDSEIDKNSTRALAELQLGEHGAYADIDPSIRLAAKKSAIAREKQLVAKQGQVEKIQKSNTLDELMDLQDAGILQSSLLWEKHQNREISASAYKSFMDNQDKPFEISKETDGKTFFDLTKMLQSPDVDAESARMALVDANTKGLLSKDDMKLLYQAHLKPTAEGMKSIEDYMGQQKFNDDYEKVIVADDAKKKELVAQNDKIGKAINWITKETKNLLADPQKPMNMIKDFLGNVIKKGLGKEEEIMNEAEVVLRKDNLKRRPDLFSKAPKEGMDAHDRFGRRVRIYPDGRIVYKDQ